MGTPSTRQPFPGAFHRLRSCIHIARHTDVGRPFLIHCSGGTARLCARDDVGVHRAVIVVWRDAYVLVVQGMRNELDVHVGRVVRQRGTRRAKVSLL
jgi:hypothetical protein